MKYDVRHFEVRPNEQDVLVLSAIKELVDKEIMKGNFPKNFYNYRNQISYSMILRIILQDAATRPEEIKKLFGIKRLKRQLRKIKRDFEESRR